MQPKHLALVAATLALGACATTASLTQEELNQRYAEVAKLQSQVSAARGADVALLAPSNYHAANSKLLEAMTAAERAQQDNARKAANEGLQAIARANADAATSRDVLAEVIDARHKASSAGATKLFATEFENLDKQLADASNLIERGKIESAKEARPILQAAFSNLELKSVKEGTVQLAKETIASARKQGADDLAPKTLAQAQQQLDLAQSTLDADRSQRDKADQYATGAITLAERAANITELVRDFDRRDFSHEDIVLWYQGELSKIASAAGENPTFAEPNRDTVGRLQTRVTALNEADVQKGKTIDELNAQLAAANDRYAADTSRLQREFAGQLAAREVAQEEQDARFRRVEDMFDDQEANVFMRQNTVLISAHGFSFAPGKSEIGTENFPLLHKIVSAITEFKGAKIHIYGHTDGTGDAAKNLALSQQRAENVAKFLTQVGGVPADAVDIEGYGKERPVASNDTADGRALNRRVEIVITPPGK
jgi:outer membrane protein OmpA-like peptidoglycan-associated protein